jgi:acetoin utilization deacetylase AcuC-like enzyme
LPSRVEAIKNELLRSPNFQFMNARRFPETRLARLHHYHGFIKAISLGITDDETEYYPDLFPGEGAHLPHKVRSPLWAGLYCTDAVTPILRHTYAAARGSAECALTGAALLQAGKVREVYALCRPSGHHAGPRVFGGYCYFNNCALAARLLSDTGRVAVLDLDYHHGNGTQEFFERRADIFTCSIHANPADEYPYFWGYASERGKGPGRDANLNLPLPKGTGNERYCRAVDRALRAIRRYDPAYLIVACGVDTHAKDPIGGFALTTTVYRDIGARLAGAGLPTLLCQEGGYNIGLLGRCVRHLLEGFEAGRRAA